MAIREIPAARTEQNLVLLKPAATTLMAPIMITVPFEKYARAYGIDYAIVRDRSGEIPKYLCFFKARDTDAMTAAFSAYSAEVLKKEQAPSVLKELARLKEFVRTLPAKGKKKKKERSLNR